MGRFTSWGIEAASPIVAMRPACVSSVSALLSCHSVSPCRPVATKVFRVRVECEDLQTCRTVHVRHGKLPSRSDRCNTTGDHTLNRMSAILYGSPPYICGSYFLASGEVTGRAFDRSRVNARKKTLARIILRCQPASLSRYPSAQFTSSREYPV
jgi:hypothetical protein